MAKEKGKLQKQNELLTLGILQEKNKYDKLKASHTKLLGYTKHKHSCHLEIHGWGFGHKCDCGLDQAIGKKGSE